MVEGSQSLAGLTLLQQVLDQPILMLHFLVAEAFQQMLSHHRVINKSYILLICNIQPWHNSVAYEIDTVGAESEHSLHERVGIGLHHLTGR